MRKAIVRLYILHLHRSEAIECVINMKQEQTVHIAIMDIPTIKKIVTGTKTVESRFSRNRIKPFSMVNPNDIVLMKSSGSGIFGFFTVDYVESYENFDINDIRLLYDKMIVADDAFWKNKENSRYASLMHCKNSIVAASGVYMKRKGMDGWITLPQNKKRQVVCFAGSICSGKSSYAKQVANILSAKYIHFGTIVKKYAVENGFGTKRSELQLVGQMMYENLGSEGLIELVRQEIADLPESKHIVFDGVRHTEIYNKILKYFGCATLVYVEANIRERYKRYIYREQHNVTYADFIATCAANVESEIPLLKEMSDFSIKSMPETNLKAGIKTTSQILVALLTGQLLEDK